MALHPSTIQKLLALKRRQPHVGVLADLLDILLDDEVEEMHSALRVEESFIDALSEELDRTRSDK